MKTDKLRKGILITFEGPEGCGKTTQARLLARYLKGRGYVCVLTREPGGTKAGELIRGVLLHSDGVRISDITELFLFEAARAQIVRQVIVPALAKKKIVICDRFSDATRSYQGYAGGVPSSAVEAADAIATGGLHPDLTVLLDIDTVTGLKRARAKGTDRMETKRLVYHRRVRRGYLALAKKFPGRIKVVKVRSSIPDTQDAVRREAEIVLRRYKRPA